jgi:hypothetical protein
VWISGFFGSGKSHLLKMLAHLLGDVEGQDFDRSGGGRELPLQGHDAFLPPLLDKATRIPAKSLLFNIDQKATLITKDQTDALLKVFVKVFDESRGYYGNQGHVARFERRPRQAAVSTTHSRRVRTSMLGIPWTQGREQSALGGSQHRRAFAEVNGETEPRHHQAVSVASYAVSIEDFADEVKAWLDKQPGFRLNFYVDEVGQFIGTNTHLMLNLQTIAESLNTKCRAGLGVRHLAGGHGQGRRRPHPAAGKRLLEDPGPVQAPGETHQRRRRRGHPQAAAGEERRRARRRFVRSMPRESANFKTLFDFVDGAKTYRNYTDEEHFVGTYPFVSYQFPLFQAAIEGISDHNVFEGRNSSVGERSMLGVVQQVAKDIGNVEVGTWPRSTRCSPASAPR